MERPPRPRSFPHAPRQETPAPQNSEVPISAAEAEAADPTEIGFDGAADISPNLGELLVQDGKRGM